MSDGDDAYVYEICPKCNGAGTAEHVDGPKPCDACQLLRVRRIPNLSHERLNKLIRDDINRMYENYAKNSAMALLHSGRVSDGNP